MKPAPVESFQSYDKYGQVGSLCLIFGPHDFAVLQFLRLAEGKKLQYQKHLIQNMKAQGMKIFQKLDYHCL